MPPRPPRPTTEPELTAAVDLCTPDGRRLAPDAVGRSRTPLHTCNLGGRWGRTKRWDYWCVLTDRHAFAVVYGDVDYLGLASVWWADLTDGTSGGRDVARPLARGLALPDRPGTDPLTLRHADLDLDLTNDADGTTHLAARWVEPDGRPGAADVAVARPPGHESLNVVIPWSETQFQFTSKHQARPATGTVTVGDVAFDLAGGYGVLDVGRGRWPYRTRWNWGGGAGMADTGATVGIQVGGRWTRGTGATENGVIVDGRLTKVGAELIWVYDWDAPLAPWRVVDPDGHLDLTLHPVHDKQSATHALVADTEVHQVFGTWTGWVATDDGTVHRLDGVTGFAEESRSRW